jgi:hypothetical protein
MANLKTMDLMNLCKVTTYTEPVGCAGPAAVNKQKNIFQLEEKINHCSVKLI